MNSRRLLGSLLIAIVLVLSRAGAGGLAASVTPTVVPSNHVCPSASGLSLKQANPATGTYTDGIITVNLTVTANPATLSFTATGVRVGEVVVKGQSESNAYHYQPTVTSDTNLIPPNGDPKVNQVVFCYGTDAPVAVNDSRSTAEDIAVTVAAPGVLTNDSDVNGDPLTAVLGTGPANGSLTLNANGSYTYTPNANFSGTDSFTYRASDGALTSNLATVTITVTSAADAPVADDETYAATEDTILNVPVSSGVLVGDTDADGNPLTAVLVDSPATGTLTFNSNGAFSYVPAANASGTVSFTYRASDGTLTSNLATVTINIAAVNDAPVAANDTASTAEDTAIFVPAPGVRANDSDVDSATLTASIVTSPSNGTVNFNADGSYTYTPAANFNGTDSFTYRISDGSLFSAAATVTITVVAVADAPVAIADSFTTAEDALLTVAAPGVLGNDSNPDGRTLTAVLGTTTANGTLVLATDGSFTYRPALNFSGTDPFTYSASDGTVTSDPVTVTITIAAINDAPVSVADAYTTDEDATLTIAATGVLANDTDTDSAALTAILVTGPSNGTLSLHATGAFTYTRTSTSAAPTVLPTRPTTGPRTATRSP